MEGSKSKLIKEFSLGAWLAQSMQVATLDLGVAHLSPTLSVEII